MHIIKNLGLFEFLKIILNRVEKLYKYHYLKNTDFSVNFLYEDDIIIKLPKVTFWQTIIGRWDILKKTPTLLHAPPLKFY